MLETKIFPPIDTVPFEWPPCVVIVQPLSAVEAELLWRRPASQKLAVGIAKLSQNTVTGSKPGTLGRGICGCTAAR